MAYGREWRGIARRPFFSKYKPHDMKQTMIRTLSEHESIQYEVNNDLVSTEMFNGIRDVQAARYITQTTSQLYRKILVIDMTISTQNSTYNTYVKFKAKVSNWVLLELVSSKDSQIQPILLYFCSVTKVWLVYCG